MKIFKLWLAKRKIRSIATNIEGVRWEQRKLAMELSELEQAGIQARAALRDLEQPVKVGSAFAGGAQ